MKHTYREGFVNVNQIALARKYLNLTQVEIAKEIKMNPNNFGFLENGKTDPKWSNLKKIIDFFESKGIIFLRDGSVIRNNQ